jgi:hypothetical protein
LEYHRTKRIDPLVRKPDLRGEVNNLVENKQPFSRSQDETIKKESKNKSSHGSNHKDSHGSNHKHTHSSSRKDTGNHKHTHSSKHTHSHRKHPLYER